MPAIEKELFDNTPKILNSASGESPPNYCYDIVQRGFLLTLVLGRLTDYNPSEKSYFYSIFGSLDFPNISSLNEWLTHLKTLPESTWREGFPK